MKNYLVLLGSVGIIVAMFLGVSFLANAQTSTSASVSGTTTLGSIIFPITELGNCASKDECRAYCNDPVNTDACIAFGQFHGLMSHAEANLSQRFTQAIQNGGGPGGCTTPGACKAYCSDFTHATECLAFAKQIGLKNDDVSQAEKISAYVKSGGTTPGGCTSKESCQAYCGDFSHAEECYNFAKQAGITQTNGQGKGVQGGIPSGQFQKFLELVKNGQTPGGCASKDTCEAYCNDQTHFADCLAFAKNVGAVSSSSAQSLEISGGKGPGDCDSRSACAAYCNDPSHQDECYSFAEKHDLIPKDQLDAARTGYSQLLEGLSQLPSDVAACVTATLGDQLSEIQAGTLAPGPEIGAKIKDCFEKFGKKENPGAAFFHLPPQILSCLKEKLGDGFIVPTSTAGLSPDIVQSFRMCKESMNIEHEENEENGTSTPSGNPHFDLERFLHSAPPGVVTCVEDKLGGQTITSPSTGMVPPEIYPIIKGCMQEFRPYIQNGSGTKPFGDGEGEHEGFFPPQKNGGTGIFNTAHMPEEFAQCIHDTLTPDEIAQFKSSERHNPDLLSKVKACYGQQHREPPSYGGSPTQPPFASGTSPTPPSSNFGQLPPPSTSTSGGTPPPNNTTSPTCPSGQSWNGTSCVTPPPDPATMCAQQGGTWTGTTCQMPASAPSSFLGNFSAFGALLKVFAPLFGIM